MMEHETLNVPSPKDDLEEGEVNSLFRLGTVLPESGSNGCRFPLSSFRQLSESDSDGYTPLARPEAAKSEFASASVNVPRQMDIVSDEHDDDELHNEKSDSDGSSGSTTLQCILNPLFKPLHLSCPAQNAQP